MIRCSRISSILLHSSNNNSPLKASAAVSAVSSSLPLPLPLPFSFSFRSNTNNATTKTSSSKESKNKVTLESYKKEKENSKNRREELYNKKQIRKSNLSKRRGANNNNNNNNKNANKNAFHKWFDTKRNNELYYDRLAKRNNQKWKIKLGLMIERLPVVTNEMEQWELDYMYLKAKLEKETCILYPKEIVGFISDPKDLEGDVLTKEQIYEQLPEEFQPAPRITEADKTNNIQTTQRKLSQRVYLAIRSSTNDEIGGGGGCGSWSLPITELRMNENPNHETKNGNDNDNDNNETFVDGVKRFIQSNEMLKGLNIRCLSNCPMTVDVIPYHGQEQAQAQAQNKEQNAEEYFGEKIFYMRVQYEDGEVNDVVGNNDGNIDDWGWLERNEMVEKVKAEKGENASLFYHYML